MMNQKDAAAYALEQLQKAGADDAAVLVTTGKIDEMNIDGGEFSLMRSGFKSGKPAISISIPAKKRR